MRVFVPVEDASVDADAGALVPYRCGVVCAHELRGSLVLRNGVWSERVALNASVFGKPLYDAMGYVESDEPMMRLRL